MKFGVLGTGMKVGKAVAQKLAKLGHDVKLGSRAPDTAKAKGSAFPVVSTSRPQSMANGLSTRYRATSRWNISASARSTAKFSSTSRTTTTLSTSRS